MNKKRFAILGIVVILTLIIAGTLIWFFSPGIHRLFNWVHVDCVKNGYLLKSTGEIIGTATLTADGNAKTASSDGTRAKADSFSIEISGLSPITKKDVAGAYVIERHNDILELNVSIAYPFEDTKTGTTIIGTHYRVLFDAEQPDTLVCIVQEQSSASEETYYFVVTEDPDTAYTTVQDFFLKALKK